MMESLLSDEQLTSKPEACLWAEKAEVDTFFHTLDNYEPYGDVDGTKDNNS